MFAYDGPDISSFQPVADWTTVAAAGCRFAGIRVAHGPYTGSTGSKRPGFVDGNAAANLGDARPTMRWRALYYVVTPLETPMESVYRLADFFAAQGPIRVGDLIALDWESNPNADGEYCAPEQVEATRAALAAVYGPQRIGIYASRGYLDQLDLPRFGWRWLASYTLDARAAAVARGCEVVQWTSSAQIPGVAVDRVDMNEVIDDGALDVAADYMEVIVGSPQGALDVVEPIGNGRVRVAGWVYDPDEPAESIETHIYLNGALAGGVVADKARPDVNASLGIVGDHGYDTVVALPLQVDVYGINVGDGANAHIGGRQVVDPAPGPAGPFDPDAVRAIVRAEIAATPFETKPVPAP